MTSTQTLSSTVVDLEDRATVIEKAQREYAAEHTIELTEDEFALARADALVRIQREGLRATETRLIKKAHASIRAVANGSDRRRPLSKLDLVRVWFSPLFTAVLTGWGLWSIRDTRTSVSTAQYPSWLPSEVTTDLPRYMDWFWLMVAEVGGLMTIIAVLAAASATWRTQTFRVADKVARTAAMMAAVVLLVVIVTATSYMLAMVYLPGGGQ